MKNINQMTDQEVLALTTDDLNNLITIRYAEEGVKLLEAPKPVEKKDYQGDSEFYEIHQIYFKTYEEAEILKAAMKSGFKQKYLGRNYSMYGFETVSEYDLNIDTKFLFSEEYARTIGKEKEAYEKMQEVYTKAKEEYDTNYNAAEWIREEVWNKFNEVQAKHRRLEDLKAKYVQYLSLAENNPEIALKFLVKAYGELNEEELTYIRS